MDNVIVKMIENYNPKTKDDYLNALKEVVQDIALYSLSQTNFFDHAAFYGGTALRIFYGLDRFSEDLDFSLCNVESDFKLEEYFGKLDETFKVFGLDFTASTKVKSIDSNIQSAFLKGNTLKHILLIQPPEKISTHIQSNEVIKIKFEVDINPPEKANYEYKNSIFPYPFRVKIFDMPSLFAGKIHALLCREWKSRPKGRDLYDFDFYLDKGTVLNIEHLQKRLEQSKRWNPNEILTIDNVKQMLKDRFKSMSFDLAKDDVRPFVKDLSIMDKWNEFYFSERMDWLLVPNKIILKKVKLDVTEIGKVKILEEKGIYALQSISSAGEYINFMQAFKANAQKFIVKDDDIINWGDKTELYPEYYLLRFKYKMIDEIIFISKSFQYKSYISVKKDQYEK